MGGAWGAGGHAATPTKAVVIPTGPPPPPLSAYRASPLPPPSLSRELWVARSLGDSHGSEAEPSADFLGDPDGKYAVAQMEAARHWGTGWPWAGRPGLVAFRWGPCGGHVGGGAGPGPDDPALWPSGGGHVGAMCGGGLATTRPCGLQVGAMWGWEMGSGDGGGVVGGAAGHQGGEGRAADLQVGVLWRKGRRGRRGTSDEGGKAAAPKLALDQLTRSTGLEAGGGGCWPSGGRGEGC